MNIIGIDPGLTGGIAFIDSFGGTAVFDLPVIRDGKLAWIDGAILLPLILDYSKAPRHAAIERVHSMPKQGVASSFQFGVGFGAVLSILQAAGCAIELVTPNTWKRDLGLSRDKNASLDKARLIYPGLDLRRKKDEGKAEAVLIAHWARTKERHG